MTNRRDVFTKLNATKKLPTPSRTALEVMRLCHSETASLNEVAQVIQTDPALSAEMLKFANSAFLATGLQVASIQKATVKLGMKTVVNLALCFSLISGNKNGKSEEFNYGNFWSTSLAQAIAAKTIAGFGKEYDPDEVFVCALLSHMGQLALASLFPHEYDGILVNHPSVKVRENLEKAQFGIDSGELTTELFLDWGLPASYALAAGFYEELDSVELGESTTKRVAELLYLSYRIARLCHGVKPSPEHLDLIENMAHGFDVVKGDFSSIFDAIVSRWQEWGQTFNIPTKQCPQYNEIKASVSETD
ncbi:MAG: HDOD domain-containing protein [Proteobacteria bacterium]|nr:HDOD domain-containing protein [Pseudomonadota bacterium]MBU1456264.1 HDOD domain-containing protein [Pseudomonadota bacterium]